MNAGAGENAMEIGGSAYGARRKWRFFLRSADMKIERNSRTESAFLGRERGSRGASGRPGIGRFERLARSVPGGVPRPPGGPPGARTERIPGPAELNEI